MNSLQRRWQIEAALPAPLVERGLDSAHDRIEALRRRRRTWIAHHRHQQRRFVMPDAVEMKDHVYKILELVGSSEKSIEDAIQNAITRASKTIRDMKWFEVVQTRGHIEDGSVRHYQVTLRVGFTLER
jgi:flavin-binding protein dodecin